MGGRPGQACPRRLRGLATGPAHSSAGTRQRPSSASLHQPSPSTRPLSCLYATARRTATRAAAEPRACGDYQSTSSQTSGTVDGTSSTAAEARAHFWSPKQVRRGRAWHLRQRSGRSGGRSGCREWTGRGCCAGRSHWMSSLPYCVPLGGHLGQRVPNGAAPRLHRPGAQPSWHLSAVLLDPSAPALSLNTAPIPPIRLRIWSKSGPTRTDLVP